MKKIKKASVLLICLLILYSATVGALFKMSEKEMITLYELARVETTDVYHSLIFDCQTKVESGEMTVDEALCCITEPHEIYINSTILAAVGKQAEDGGNDIVIAAQGEMREDFKGRTLGEIFTEYYEADETPGFKKAKLEYENAFSDFTIFELDGEEYAFTFHIMVNHNYVSLVNDSFLKALAIISVLYVAIALFVIFRKPKEQEGKAASTNK